MRIRQSYINVNHLKGPSILATLQKISKAFLLHTNELMSSAGLQAIVLHLECYSQISARSNGTRDATPTAICLWDAVSTLQLNKLTSPIPPCHTKRFCWVMESWVTKPVQTILQYFLCQLNLQQYAINGTTKWPLPFQLSFWNGWFQVAALKSPNAITGPWKIYIRSAKR